jgi:hypothetical protein
MRVWTPAAIIEETFACATTAVAMMLAFDCAVVSDILARSPTAAPHRQHSRSAQPHSMRRGEARRAGRGRAKARSFQAGGRTGGERIACGVDRVGQHADDREAGDAAGVSPVTVQMWEGLAYPLAQMCHGTSPVLVQM